jgi:predicted  nucleic acid-binding Zn-ribbon protein
VARVEALEGVSEAKDKSLSDMAIQWAEMYEENERLREALEKALTKIKAADDGGYHLNPYQIDDAQEIIQAALDGQEDSDGI